MLNLGTFRKKILFILRKEDEDNIFNINYDVNTNIWISNKKYIFKY